jgi:hypothetical protein
MIFAYVILATAVLLSAVAAYYSIAGLTAIFAAAVIPVVIMGASLELGKVVATVWLHNNWKRVNWVFKTYLIPAIVFLMLLTSMGIFGFLSKAHSDQSLVSGDAMSKVAIFDEKIATEKENIAQAKKAIEQMNAQVDQMLGRSDTERGAERAVSIRRNQAKERAALQADIVKSQKIIQKLQEERAPLAAEFRKVEAEVGPIKYIAALLYGDNPDQNILERSVRWVIILIVIVFDPLALCLILAGNKQLEWVREDKKKKNNEVQEIIEKWEPQPVVAEPDPEPEKFNPDKVEVTEAEDEAFRSLEPKQEPETVGLIQDVEEAASVDYGDCPKCGTKLLNADGIGPFCPNKECDIVDGPFDYEPEMASDIVELDQPTQIVNSEPLSSIEEPKSLLPEITSGIETVGVTIEPFKKLPGDYVEFEGKRMHARVLRDLRPDLFTIKSNSTWKNGVDFGKQFPQLANTGDIFIRTDILPHRIFKFNKDKWIELAKENSDSYLSNDHYVRYLIDLIGSGELDPELLTQIEQEVVEEFIRKPNK